MRILILLTLLVSLTGCGGLAFLGPNTSADQAKQIMDYSKARGCLYFKGNARPYADADTTIIGTWGEGNAAPDIGTCAKYIKEVQP